MASILRDASKTATQAQRIGQYFTTHLLPKLAVHCGASAAWPTQLAVRRRRFFSDSHCASLSRCVAKRAEGQM
eukprot:6289734-Pyramimonas_sp.AAC.1